MELYNHQEAEASALYKMLCTNLELYNRKLTTLERTRDIIKGMSEVVEFYEWDSMYVARKALKLNVIKLHISIILFWQILNFVIYLKILSNIIKHSWTLLNIYFQGQEETLVQPSVPVPPTLPVPSISTVTGIQTRWCSSTEPQQMPLQKRYKSVKCEHPPFQMKYGLACYVSIKHKDKGVQCEICGKSMLSYHLPDHKDSHALFNRYICKERSKKTSAVCGKGYIQKSAFVWHLKTNHKGKSLPSAKVQIIDRSKVQYETKDDYQVEKEMAAEEVNRLVDELGEQVYVE